MQQYTQKMNNMIDRVLSLYSRPALDHSPSLASTQLMLHFVKLQSRSSKTIQSKLNLKFVSAI